LLKNFIQNWLVNTLAVLVAVYLLNGIHYQKPLDLVVASLLLGILNAVLRPLLMILAFPLLLLTLGLFRLIINAFILYFIGFLLEPHFYVDGFWPAFWGALIISVISVILNALTATGGATIRVQRHRRPPGPGPSGGGPVIDV
jgi:putative membrane protein